nr:PREDICTED: zinc transporter ZIP6-like [Bemisia tabaci]
MHIFKVLLHIALCFVLMTAIFAHEDGAKHGDHVDDKDHHEDHPDHEKHGDHVDHAAHEG